MRILIVSDTTGYMRGGVPAVTRELIAGLAARGHVVGFCGDIPLADAHTAEHFPLSFPPDAELAAQVREAVARFKPGFVHVMSMSSRGVAALIPLLADHSWLLTCHSIPPSERKLSALHGNELLHYGARDARYLPNTLAWVMLFRRGHVPHVVAHSAGVAQTAVRYGHDAERTTMIPLGCDAVGRPRLRMDLASAQAPFVVTTGGIAHTKGYHDAIAALATVRNSFPGIRYQIIGEVRDESYLSHLRTLIARHRLGDQVFITPSLPNEDKLRALEAADLYLQPSHEEGFCLGYIEAALVVPRLVGTDTGAIALISEEDEGANVVPPRSPNRLAEAVRDMLSKKIPLATMPTRFARLQQRFSWRGYLDAHESLYASLLRRRAQDAGGETAD